MTEDFNKWWNADQGYDGVTNPYRSDSAVYWAWEGWQAAMKVERKWQGLTDDEIKQIVGGWKALPIAGYTRKLFDQIEAKLKEKNT
jgi:hypothetical protein